MRTLGQKRAEYALEKVLAIPEGKKKEDFKSFSAGAPSMILQNGFGQALAFWISKAKEGDKHRVLFNMVKEWLIDNNFVKPQNNNNAEFIKALSAMEQSSYHSAQKETLALLEWVKRYANADL